VIQQGVNQGARIIARSGVNYHPLRFIYHKQIVILINDIKGNILRQGFKGLRLGHDYHNPVPGLAFIVLFTATSFTVTAPLSSNFAAAERVKRSDLSLMNLSIRVPISGSSTGRKIVLIIAFLRGLFILFKDIQHKINHKRNCAEGNGAVCNIEDCKIHKGWLNKINHVAVKNTVYQIADAPATITPMLQ
jgi:hypothetical protein